MRDTATGPMCFRPSDEYRERIKAVATDMGYSSSDFMRHALYDYVDAYINNPKKKDLKERLARLAKEQEENRSLIQIFKGPDAAEPRRTNTRSRAVGRSGDTRPAPSVESSDAAQPS